MSRIPEPENAAGGGEAQLRPVGSDFRRASTTPGGAPPQQFGTPAALQLHASALVDSPALTVADVIPDRGKTRTSFCAARYADHCSGVTSMLWVADGFMRLPGSRRRQSKPGCPRAR